MADERAAFETQDVEDQVDALRATYEAGLDALEQVVRSRMSGRDADDWVAVFRVRSRAWCIHAGTPVNRVVEELKSRVR